jgi:ketosteroid isomerase-like protein
MIAAIVSLLLSANLQTASASPEIAELNGLERVWNEAHLGGDADALDRLFDDDIVITVPGMPMMGKSSSLGVIRNARMKFDRYETTDLQVHAYGQSAVVTGRLRRTRTNDGRTADDDWRFTKTYVRRGGDWRVVAFHASLAAAP